MRVYTYAYPELHKTAKDKEGSDVSFDLPETNGIFADLEKYIGNPPPGAFKGYTSEYTAAYRGFDYVRNVLIKEIQQSNSPDDAKPKAPDPGNAKPDPGNAKPTPPPDPGNTEKLATSAEEYLFPEELFKPYRPYSLLIARARWLKNSLKAMETDKYNMQIRAGKVKALLDRVNELIDVLDRLEVR